VRIDGSRPLSSRDATRIAEAFELSPDQVHEDADLVAGWKDDEHVLRGLLQERHDWDASVAPYYVFWLRGDGVESSE
jgi:hypothetical protein